MFHSCRVDGDIFQQTVSSRFEYPTVKGDPTINAVQKETLGNRDPFGCKKLGDSRRQSNSKSMPPLINVMRPSMAERVRELEGKRGGIGATRGHTSETGN